MKILPFCPRSRFLLFLLGIGTIVFASCAEKTVPKRIVMLGDGGHGHRYYFQTVTSVLNLWLEDVENESAPRRNPGLEPFDRMQLLRSVPRDVILFLETEPEEAQAIDHYLTSTRPWPKQRIPTTFVIGILL